MKIENLKFYNIQAVEEASRKFRHFEAWIQLKANLKQTSS